MTYALMVWVTVTCAAYTCSSDWRQVMNFEGNPGAKVLCEEAAQDLFKDRKYKCVRTK